MDENIEDEQYELILQHQEEQQNDPWKQFLDTLEGYCELCDVAGHTVRTCPTRDDNELWEM